ncbi:hypothetical protein ACQVQY_31765 [Bacillus mycoides]|uniref:hypothetical protein n=1 Tax=Bacillus mycoides TaxID=1405 RepID=UPI003D6475A9
MKQKENYTIYLLLGTLLTIFVLFLQVSLASKNTAQLNNQNGNVKTQKLNEDNRTGKDF